MPFWGKETASSSQQAIFYKNNVNAGVPQGSIVGPSLILIYINDLSEGISINAKPFSDDRSFFSVINNIQTSENCLNIKI